MTYQWKAGSRIKADAQRAADMMNDLERKGNLTVKALLDANRPEDAPLHNEFEWNDSEAAERYREQQARHIINCLVIVSENKPPVRQFFNITNSDPNYQSIGVLLSAQDTKEALLARAMNELRAFQMKYAQLNELAAVFAAIEDLPA